MTRVPRSETAAHQATLARLATGRQTSLFANDMQVTRPEVVRVLRGARVLVTGGAGSIGGETTRLLAALPLSALHVVDISENSLVELVRDLRAGEEPEVDDFRTFVVDYGATPMRRLLAAEKPYDFVLNFAAHKHVRGERDGFSLLSMVDTNIVKLARFKEWLAQYGHGLNFFSVSTDKAANPVSMMGASKRVMEDVAFDVATRPGGRVTSARFANVAYSNGSLPLSFLSRLEKGQPLAAPRNTRRYFISLEEAGQLCLLAATLLEGNRVAIPDLDPASQLVDLVDLAERVLRSFGLEPILVTDEVEARGLALEPPVGRYPLLVTPLDTAGEKPYEEFVADSEIAEILPFEALNAVRHRPATDVRRLIDQIARLGESNDPPDLLHQQILSVLEKHLGNFRHAGSALNLDQRI